MCKPLPCKNEGRLDRNSRTSTITLLLFSSLPPLLPLPLPPVVVVSAWLSPTFTPPPTAFQCTVLVSMASAIFSLEDDDDDGCPLAAPPVALVLRAVVALAPPPPPRPTAWLGVGTSIVALASMSRLKASVSRRTCFRH